MTEKNYLKRIRWLLYATWGLFLIGVASLVYVVNVAHLSDDSTKASAASMVGGAAFLIIWTLYEWYLSNQARKDTQSSGKGGH